MLKKQKRSSNILLVDIGNTSTCVGLGSTTAHGLHRIDTATSDLESIRKAICEISPAMPVADGVICSVVPQLNRLWIGEIKRVTGRTPLLVNHHVELGVKLNYPKLGTIGADRLANVSGAAGIYGSPVLVADFGTATTFDIIDNKGCFVGGVIAPGLRLMTDYMADRTAQLPRISTGGALPGIGRSTRQAMKIGAIIGYRGLVREITMYLIRKNNLGKIRLLATGGLAGTVLKGIDLPYTVNARLTLDGIYRIYNLNRTR
jgi:type III pantothenate kinase